MQPTTRHLLKHMRRQLDGKPSPLPAPGQLVWRWFLDLCRTRTSHGYGPNPLAYAEIEAYARLYRWPMEPRHVDMILALDRVWIEQARIRADNADGANPRGPAQPLTPDAFDAVFA